MVKPFVGADSARARPMPPCWTCALPLGQPRARAAARPDRGVALSAGINPAYGALDPYAMAWAAVDEAMRNCVAVGADPDQVALLDNFCWGNPALPDRLGGLVRCAEGCYDAALAYGAPFISGKDSLNNEYTGADGRKHAIPGTLLISALGIVPDVGARRDLDLKAAGNLLYVLGLTRDELGGSAYYRLHGLRGANVPQPPATALGRTCCARLHRAIAPGLVRACHDCSEGRPGRGRGRDGLAGELGLALDLRRMPARAAEPAATRRSPSASRWAASWSRCGPEDAAAFEACLAGLPLRRTRAQVQATTCAASLIGLARPVRDRCGRAPALEQAWRGHITMSQKPTRPDPARHRHQPRPRGGLGLRAGRRRARDRPHQPADRRRSAAWPTTTCWSCPAASPTATTWAPASCGPSTCATGWPSRWRPSSRAGRPVLGICNGFQALVKAGLLPGTAGRTRRRPRPDGHADAQRLGPLRVPLGLPAAAGRQPLRLHARAGRSRSTARWRTARAGSCPRTRRRWRDLEAGGLVALRYSRPDGHRSPARAGRIPLEPERLAGRHRRHLQPGRQRAGPDAASGRPHHPGAGPALSAAASAANWAWRCSETACATPPSCRVNRRMTTTHAHLCERLSTSTQ